MTYEDRISIATPEGVRLDMVLAGLGSRFVATLVDSAIKAAVVLGALIGLAFLGSGADPRASGEPAEALIGLAIFFIFSFLVSFGYDVAFETLGSGRTPGKAVAGLRVVRSDGAPVSFVPSAVRNLLRLADILPFAYAAGTIAILATARNQRLGDLAADTIVIREQRGRAGATWLQGPRAPADESLATWDVSSVGSDDIALIRRFLDRRGELSPEARGRIATDFAARIGGRVAGAPTNLHPETFLESVLAAKSARS